MEPTIINCYLCSNHEAKKFNKSIGEDIMDITVECPVCIQYLVPIENMMFIFESKDKEEKLNTEDKLKLSRFVQNQFKQTGKPVRITRELIKNVTGKRLMHTTYK